MIESLSSPVRATRTIFVLGLISSGPGLLNDILAVLPGGVVSNSGGKIGLLLAQGCQSVESYLAQASACAIKHSKLSYLFCFSKSFIKAKGTSGRLRQRGMAMKVGKRKMGGKLQRK